MKATRQWTCSKCDNKINQGQEMQVLDNGTISHADECMAPEKKIPETQPRNEQPFRPYHEIIQQSIFSNIIVCH